MNEHLSTDGATDVARLRCALVDAQHQRDAALAAARRLREAARKRLTSIDAGSADDELEAAVRATAWLEGENA